MAADSFHAEVENELRKKKYLYDFGDFVSAVNNRGSAAVMTPNDFKYFMKELSFGTRNVNYPLLTNVKEVMFKKDYTKMFWKSDLRAKEYFSGEFAKEKYRKTVKLGNPHIQRCEDYRGVQTEKVMDIIKKIGPLIPKEKLVFWENLRRRDN